jgi:hypothetical protein
MGMFSDIIFGKENNIVDFMKQNSKSCIKCVRRKNMPSNIFLVFNIP